MGPRPNPLWEFWSLGLWWAAWTLADRYLIPYTPAPELLVIVLCMAVAAVARVARWRNAPRATAPKRLEADGADGADGADAV
ncbi:MAG: hypothetical protein CMI16_07670 [Opitutaceae bacterium]|nr:hypothetical protein [Opitutaceae bacterium]